MMEQVQERYEILQTVIKTLQNWSASLGYYYYYYYLLQLSFHLVAVVLKLIRNKNDFLFAVALRPNESYDPHS
jgi:hypothetical protein